MIQMHRLHSAPTNIYKKFKGLLINETNTIQSVKPLSDKLTKTVTPIFVLSTGRCGTKWLTKLLSSSKFVFLNHSLQPELVRQSKLAYEMRLDNPNNLGEFVRAARDDLISYAYCQNLTYVETNNKITFFAHTLSKIYPRSKFIHLYRHPSDFVRSGMRRNWYESHLSDLGRITMKSFEKWQKMTQFEKIAWLWNETNYFIECFLNNIHNSQHISLACEDMFSVPGSVAELCEFIGAEDISNRHIKKIQRKRVNVQNYGNFPNYKDWPQELKIQLGDWCPLAVKYGYLP